MKLLSDERLATLADEWKEDAEQVVECGMQGIGEDVEACASAFAELQVWRAAFKGVKMVVPVEWETKHYMDRLYTSTGRHLVALSYKLDNRQPFESGLGVIRLDELLGDAGELEDGE